MAQEPSDWTSPAGAAAVRPALIPDALIPDAPIPDAPLPDAPIPGDLIPGAPIPSARSCSRSITDCSDRSGFTRGAGAWPSPRPVPSGGHNWGPQALQPLRGSWQSTGSTGLLCMGRLP